MLISAQHPTFISFRAFSHRGPSVADGSRALALHACACTLIALLFHLTSRWARLPFYRGMLLCQVTVHGMRYIIFRVVFCAESKPCPCFSQHVRFLRFVELYFCLKNYKLYQKSCKKLFKRRETHDFDAFLNAESINCSVFSVSYTIPEIIEEKYSKKHEKMVLQKTSYALNIIYFAVNCMWFSSFFDAEKISRKLIVPAVTVRRCMAVELPLFTKLTIWRLTSTWSESLYYKYLLYRIALNSTIFAIFTIYLVHQSWNSSNSLLNTMNIVNIANMYLSNSYSWKYKRFWNFFCIK